MHSSHTTRLPSAGGGRRGCTPPSPTHMATRPRSPFPHPLKKPLLYPQEHARAAAASHHKLVHTLFSVSFRSVTNATSSPTEILRSDIVWGCRGHSWCTLTSSVPPTSVPWDPCAPPMASASEGAGADAGLVVMTVRANINLLPSALRNVKDNVVAVISGMLMRCVAATHTHAHTHTHTLPSRSARVLCSVCRVSPAASPGIVKLLVRLRCGVGGAAWRCVRAAPGSTLSARPTCAAALLPGLTLTPLSHPASLGCGECALGVMCVPRSHGAWSLLLWLRIASVALQLRRVPWQVQPRAGCGAAVLS
jgi:hypothetical protein